MNVQGWKTYLVSLLTIAVGALPQILAGTDWAAFMVDPKTGMGLIVGGVFMAVMRKVTEATTVKSALYAEPPKSDKP